MKVLALQSVITGKQHKRLKALEKSKEPVSLKHIITDHYGGRYQVELDFLAGYNEKEAIEGINRMFPMMDGRPVSVELVSIGPIPDRSAEVKPQGEC